MNEITYWGHHLRIDAGGCNIDSLKDYDNIYNFAKHLVEDIDMVAYGEPQIVKFGHGDKEGYTLVQLIETSNICAHLVDEYREIYLDVFSCKMFEPEKVVDLVKQYFGATTYIMNFEDRKAPKA